MADLPVTDRPRTVLFCLCLVAAPLAEVVEAVLSPLTGGSTADDLGAIAGAPGRFTASVLVGLLGTVLLLPALLGLARRASDRSPALALVAAGAIVVSLLGFAGVRMGQAFELGLATGPLSQADAAAAFEASIGTPMGATLTVMFLAGNVVGVIVLAIALWRSHRVPIGSIVLFLLFPIADLAVPGHLGPIVSHVILLGAFAWMAFGFLRVSPARAPRAARAPEAAASTIAR